MPSISPPLIVLIVLALWAVSMRLYLASLHARILESQSAILKAYWNKAHKIPALVETLKAAGIVELAFREITVLHSKTLGVEAQSVYEILESNKRIQDEFRILMKLSHHSDHIEKNPAFITTRDAIIVAERDIKREVIRINRLIWKYSVWRVRKNLTVLGVLLPAEEKLRFSL